MKEQDFKDQFVTGFLSSWCGSNYEDFIMYGQVERLSSPPVEDAIHLADEAWEKYKEEKDSV